MDSFIIKVNLQGGCAALHDSFNIDSVFGYFAYHANGEQYDSPLNIMGKYQDRPIFESSVFYGDIVYSNTIEIYKRATQNAEKYYAQKPKKSGGYAKVMTSSGRYRDYIITIPVYYFSSPVCFLCKGDIGKAETVLQQITTLGKKGSIGLGVVSNITVTPCKEFNLHEIDGAPGRVFPQELHTGSGKTSSHAFTYPYHDSALLSKCVMPKIPQLRGLDSVEAYL